MEIQFVERWTEPVAAQLADLLAAVVEDGASVGFVLPVVRPEIEAYWAGARSPQVRLWVALVDNVVVGTVHLRLAHQPNAPHRAEVAKLLVHPGFRQRGIARRLMHAAEARALSEGRTLLVLDTRAGDPSNDLYRSLGFVEVGSIPDYALSPDGLPAPCVFYYKQLA